MWVSHSFHIRVHEDPEWGLKSDISASAGRSSVYENFWTKIEQKEHYTKMKPLTDLEPYSFKRWKFRSCLVTALNLCPRPKRRQSAFWGWDYNSNAIVLLVRQCVQVFLLSLNACFAFQRAKYDLKRKDWRMWILNWRHEGLALIRIGNRHLAFGSIDPHRCWWDNSKMLEWIQPLWMLRLCTYVNSTYLMVQYG